MIGAAAAAISLATCAIAAVRSVIVVPPQMPIAVKDAPSASSRHSLRTGHAAQIRNSFPTVPGCSIPPDFSEIHVKLLFAGFAHSACWVHFRALSTSTTEGVVDGAGHDRQTSTSFVTVPRCSDPPDGSAGKFRSLHGSLALAASSIH